MSRYVRVAKIICEASPKTLPNAVRFASTRSNNYSDVRPPQVGQRPIQPPAELRMGGPVGGPAVPPRVNILDLTCQPCEFPPPTTRTPYRKPVAVNFAARKTSISHRDTNSPAEKLEGPSSSALSSVQQTKERMYSAVSDKTSKELVAKLQVSTRSMKKANDSLANCFKTAIPGRNNNMNK